MEKFIKSLEIEIFRVGEFSLTISKVISVFLTILITFLIIWLIKKVLFRMKRKNIDEGILHSIFQISKYVIWIITILIILDSLGIKLNVLLAGSAALLVGIGLGLQNTFNNFIAGIILLFEGSLKVGDIIEVDGDVVKIQRIGLRTSTAISRDDISVILPNSILTSNKLINWSHQSKKTI